MLIKYFLFQDPPTFFSSTRQSAIRLKHLPPGTVQFETVTETDLLGTIIQDVNGIDPGLIGYTDDDQEKSIIFFTKDCDAKNIPKLNDKVINILYKHNLKFIKYILYIHLFNFYCIFIGEIQYLSSKEK